MAILRWLADECVAAELVGRLRAAGHDVAFVLEDSPGISDTEIVQRAAREDRLLLTEDRDFGELIIRQLLSVPGVVLLRFEIRDRHAVWSRLDEVIQNPEITFWGHHTVIEVARYRTRRLLTD